MAYNKGWSKRQQMIRKKKMEFDEYLKEKEQAQKLNIATKPPKVVLPKNELWKIHNTKVITLTLAREFGVPYLSDKYDFESLFEDNIAEIKHISISSAFELLSPYYTEFRYPSFTKANFALLQKDLGFSAIECDTLAYIFCVENLIKTSFDTEKIDLYMHANLISRIFGHRVAAIKNIFQQESRLTKIGFLQIDTFHRRSFSISNALDFIFTMQLSTDTLIKEFGYRPNLSKLTIEDFDYMDKKIDMILNYAQKVKNASILLYGDAGVGKSELVSVIAQKLGREVICVKNVIANDDDNSNDSKAVYRMRSFATLQHLLKNDEHIAFFDECEDTICYKTINRKAGINTMLENVKVLNFFASNSYDMDPAFLRRFDFVCEIKAPPKSKKIAIIKSRLQKSKITLSQPLLEAVATNPHLTQGNLLKSANVASTFGKEQAQKIFIKCINETLRAKNQSPIKPKKQSKKPKKAESSAMPYDMELIECSTDIVVLSQNIKNNLKPPKKANPLKLAKKEAKKAGKEFDSDFLLDFDEKNSAKSSTTQNPTAQNSPATKAQNLSKNAPCGIRILAYGIAGSGKSEFAKKLSKECDKKLLSYKMSDLLSMYVGAAEKNIATAFKKAKAKGAILHIDEIDSIGYNREGATHSWERTIVNELLTQMEDYEGIFIATSNHLDCLDSAILRRFDSKIEFKPLRGKKLKKAFAMYAEYLGLDFEVRDFGIDCSADSSADFGIDSSVAKSPTNASDSSKTSAKDSSLPTSHLKNASDFSKFASIEKELEKLENICFGDFALIAREARFAPLKTAQDLLSKLQAESKIKHIGRGSAKVGF